MSETEQSPSVTASHWRWHLLAAAILLGVAALRVWYLASACTLDLAPDEAHYWDWSRHPDWSYYSKGPAVAYLIRGATFLAELFGAASVLNPVLVVRLPAVLCGSLLLLSLYVLALQVYGRPRLALGVMGLALIMPLVSVGAIVMTIDAPYCCCWGWALVFGYRAIFHNSNWAWAATGLTVGAGMLAKQTMVLWLPGAGMFLMCSPDHRNKLWRPGFWLMVALAGLCSLPMVIWNAQHDWVTFRHVGGQAGVTESAGIRWLGPFQFLGAQFGLLLGFWFVAWLVGMIRRNPWREGDAPSQYLWWMSATVFGVFLAFSLKAEEQPNWPVTAYLSGLVLGTETLLRQLQALRPAARRWALAGAGLCCSVSLTTTIVLHRTEWVRPQLALLAGSPRREGELPLRRLDPTCRLRGWQVLAARVDELRQQLREQGAEPVLAGTAWNLPGELGFYCSGHPTVFSLGPPLGDRHSQYDFWRPNPVLDADEFAGCTMILVGPPTPQLNEAFQSIERVPDVTFCVDGEPVARWNVTICRGYRGFAAVGGGSRPAY